MSRVCHRKGARYKYQSLEADALDIGIKGMEIDSDYLKLAADGVLTVRETYA